MPARFELADASDWSTSGRWDLVIRGRFLFLGSCYVVAVEEDIRVNEDRGGHRDSRGWDRHLNR